MPTYQNIKTSTHQNIKKKSKKHPNIKASKCQNNKIMNSFLSLCTYVDTPAGKYLKLSSNNYQVLLETTAMCAGGIKYTDDQLLLGKKKKKKENIIRDREPILQ